MIINGRSLLDAGPIIGMEEMKVQGELTSHGLGEAGYDIRVKQEIKFLFEPKVRTRKHVVHDTSLHYMHPDNRLKGGHFALASAIEEFIMPTNLTGIVHDKSTWARKGLSVFNTVIEPGWQGFLTLELVYHGWEDLTIPAGSGIAQVLFHQTLNNARYTGKYANQPNRPVPAIPSKKD